MNEGREGLGDQQGLGRRGFGVSMKIREKAGDLETDEDKGEREDWGTKEHRGEGEAWESM